jgi:glucan biosynthesis protein C
LELFFYRHQDKRRTSGRCELEERRYDIDWLRVLAMLTIFFFHNARFFDTGSWHIKNAEHSFGMLLFVGVIDAWIMPLFFLLSGVASWYSLESRSQRQYVMERISRLLVPLYTVGVFVLLPPQLYWDSVTNGRFAGSFWAFYPHYFESFRFVVLPPFLLSWLGHLWFLAFLFCISLITLPLMRFLKRESGRSVLSRLAGWCDRRGGLFLLLIPLFLVQVSLRGFFQGHYTLADLFYFLLYFMIGYIIPSDGRFTESLKRHAWACLPLALIAFGAQGALIFGAGYQYPEGQGFSPFWLYMLFQFVMSVQTLSWIIFLVGMAAKHLHFKNRALAYGNEAVLPFYVLHQTIILLVGSYVVEWSVGIPVKYMVISVTSFALIMAVYELLVRRFNWARFLFGMRLRAKAAQMQPAD